MKRSYQLIIVLASIFTLTTAGHAQGTNYARFWITDSLNNSPLAVISDAKGPVLPNQYADHNIRGGEQCVSAGALKNGFTALYAQMRDCVSALPRVVRLYFPSEVAGQPNFPGGCLANFDGVRGQYFADAYRIQLPGLFNKTGKTAVSFTFYCAGTAYNINTDADLTPYVLNNKRKITNAGAGAVTASMFLLVNGTNYPVNGVSKFAFPFEIEVEAPVK